VQVRPLGSTGIQISEIGFGTWAIGGAAAGTVGYGPTIDDESLAALAEARRFGCTFFDTSNLYGWGHAEELLGEAFAARRHSVVIATKAGYVSPDGAQDFSSGALYRSLEASLARLRSDYVDLLQLHNPPADALEDDWLCAALEAMKDDGLIRAWGVSARTPDEALLFVTRYDPACVQVNFNLGDLRALRGGLFDACRGRGIGVIVRTPLAAGFLTGQLGADETFDESDHRRRYDAGTRARWIEAVRLLNPVFADAPEATPAQNAIRFCLSFDAVSSVIPGMMRISDVQEDLAATRLPRLQAPELREVEAIHDRVFSDMTA
jgi:aryl-alcohol dehydrogenase-like predicted oxidoreductase